MRNKRKKKKWNPPIRYESQNFWLIKNLHRILFFGLAKENKLSHVNILMQFFLKLFFASNAEIADEICIFIGEIQCYHFEIYVINSIKRTPYKCWFVISLFWAMVHFYHKNKSLKQNTFKLNWKLCTHTKKCSCIHNDSFQSICLSIERKPLKS